ncbi:hypothetical protein AADZ91_07650 [Colwelliaceae bacterium 6441]
MRLSSASKMRGGLYSTDWLLLELVLVGSFAIKEWGFSFLLLWGLTGVSIQLR